MPQVITIDIAQVKRFKFPDSVFSYSSLEILELYLSRNATNIIRPRSTALPSLKILVISGILLKDDFAKMLFLGCSSLQTLKLESCDLFISEISSNVLKELTVYDCCLFRLMRISCPGLVYFSIISVMNGTRTISLENMVSLVNAGVQLYALDENLEILDVSSLSLLTGLSNVTSLELYFDSLPELQELLEKDISNCRIFKNLKSLEIRAWDMINDFDLVACFLERSPVLQQLTIHLWLNETAPVLSQPVNMKSASRYYKKGKELIRINM